MLQCGMTAAMKTFLIILVSLMFQFSAVAGPLPRPIHVPPGGPIGHPPINIELPPSIKQVVCKGFNNIATVGSTFAGYSAEARKEFMIGGYTEADRAGIYFECMDGNAQTQLYVDPSDAPLYTAMAALLANYSTQPVANAGVRALYFRYDANSTVSCNPASPAFGVIGVYGYNTGG